MAYNKYSNKPIVIDGIKFHSRKEGRRYIELKSLQAAGKISNLELQPGFVLQEKFTYNGDTYKAIVYKADFKYFDNRKQKIIFEDVKGKPTDVYKIKKKMLLYKYPGINFIET